MGSQKRMPPKFDPLQVHTLVLRVVGGEVPGGAVLAPKCGPLGLAPKKLGDDISKGTKDWKGLKVTVKCTVQNRKAQVEVIPSASALLIKALNEPVRDRKKVKNIEHDGDISIDDVYEIARTLRYKSLARKFSSTVMRFSERPTRWGAPLMAKCPPSFSGRSMRGSLSHLTNETPAFCRAGLVCGSTWPTEWE